MNVTFQYFCAHYNEQTYVYHYPGKHARKGNLNLSRKWRSEYSSNPFQWLIGYQIHHARTARRQFLRNAVVVRLSIDTFGSGAIEVRIVEIRGLT